MTLKDIKKSLERIRALSDDPEAAHTYEDDLMASFIYYISRSSNRELAVKAKLVLSSRDIEFPRWKS